MKNQIKHYEKNLRARTLSPRRGETWQIVSNSPDPVTGAVLIKYSGGPRDRYDAVVLKGIYRG